jgi:hypothetical protein
MGAQGRGLHEKITSIESMIDSSVVNKIRYIATIRNKVLHEDGFDLDQDSMSHFETACDQVEMALAEKEYTKSEKSSSGSAYETYKNSSTIKKVAIAIFAVAAFILANR